MKYFIYFYPNKDDLKLILLRTYKFILNPITYIVPQNTHKKGVPPTFRKFCTLSKFQHKYGRTPLC